MRPIDADKVIEYIKNNIPLNWNDDDYKLGQLRTFGMIMKFIKEQPTVKGKE